MFRLRPAPPVAEMPSVILRCWRIFQTDDDDVFFAGLLHDHKVRVSSEVVEFDPELQRGVTQSGRIYYLNGHPGTDRYVLAAWQQVAMARGIEICSDVTSWYARKTLQ